MKLHFYVNGKKPDAFRLCSAFRARFGQTPVARCEKIVVFGGDGTLLRAFKETLEIDGGRPLFGVNCGEYGFLMNKPPADLKDESLDLFSENIEKSRPTWVHPLRVHTRSVDGRIEEDFAINGIAFSHARVQEATDLAIHANGTCIAKRMRGDGLIVSTFIGATAYNASAWGIIPPFGEDVMLFTPLAPMLTFGDAPPPCMFEPTTRLAISACDARRRPVMLSVDNRTLFGQLADALITQDRHVRATLLHAPNAPFKGRYTRAAKKIGSARGDIFAHLSA